METQDLNQQVKDKHEFRHAKRCNRNKQPGSPVKKIVFGLLAIVAGILLICRNMGMMGEFSSHIIFSWQMLIIAIGFIGLFGRNRFLHAMLMLTGAFFLVPEFAEVPVDFVKVFWPALIVFFGVVTIIGGWSHFFGKGRIAGNGEDFIDDVAIFSGNERILYSENFKGGKLTAFFGGNEVDLSSAKLAEGKNIIETVAIFGGNTLIIPADWNVRIEVISLLGGFSDKRPKDTPPSDMSKTLLIKGVSLFGGGEIRSNKRRERR